MVCPEVSQRIVVPPELLKHVREHAVDLTQELVIAEGFRLVVAAGNSLKVIVEPRR